MDTHAWSLPFTRSLERDGFSCLKEAAKDGVRIRLLGHATEIGQRFGTDVSVFDPATGQWSVLDCRCGLSFSRAETIFEGMSRLL